jgi:hypothetical protein
VHPEGTGATTDVAADVLGGVGFHTGSVIPYLQVKAIIKNDSLFSIAVGLRF